MEPDMGCISIETPYFNLVLHIILGISLCLLMICCDELIDTSRVILGNINKIPIRYIGMQSEVVWAKMKEK